MTLFPHTKLVDAPADKYDDTVRYVVHWASKLNHDAKATKCPCAVNVSDNHKLWKKADLVKIAVAPDGFEPFNILLQLSYMAQNAKNSEDKSAAKAALAQLAPNGFTAETFRSTIVDVLRENYDAIGNAATKYKLKIIDGASDELDRSYPSGIKDAARIRLSIQPSTIKQFRLLYTLAEYATEEGYPEPQRKAREVLGSLSVDGKWETLYRLVAEVMQTDGDKVNSLIRKSQENASSSSKPSTQKPAPEGKKVGFNEKMVEGVSFAGVTLDAPAFDPQAALELLSTRNLPVSNAETINHGLTNTALKPVNTAVKAA